MHTERTQAIARGGIRCLGAAGQKKHPLAVTTARSRARETGIVAAAARQLFFAYKKKVSLCTPSARRQGLAEHEVLGRCGPKKKKHAKLQV